MSDTSVLDPDLPGYVYVIAREGTARPVKIGTTRRPGAFRFNELQTATPDKLVTLFQTRLVERAWELEQSLHQHFDAYRCDGGTEWFDIDAQVVVKELHARIEQQNEAAREAVADIERSMLALAERQRATMSAHDAAVIAEFTKTHVQGWINDAYAFGKLAGSYMALREAHSEWHNLDRNIKGAPTRSSAWRRTMCMLGTVLWNKTDTAFGDMWAHPHWKRYPELRKEICSTPGGDRPWRGRFTNRFTKRKPQVETGA